MPLEKSEVLAQSLDAAILLFFPSDFDSPNLAWCHMKWLSITLIVFLISLGITNLFADKPLARHISNSDITGLVLAKFQNMGGEDKFGLRIPAWNEEFNT